MKKTIVFILIFLFSFFEIYSQTCYEVDNQNADKFIKKINKLVQLNKKNFDSVLVFERVNKKYQREAILLFKNANNKSNFLKILEVNSEKGTLKVEKLNSKKYLESNIMNLYKIFSNQDSLNYDSINNHFCDEGNYIFIFLFRNVCLIKKMPCYQYLALAEKYRWGCLLPRRRDNIYLNSICN
jgi:hypothetical protein